MGKEIDNRCLPDIWDRFKSGDKEAFAVLYNLHIDSLYHYGTKFCKDEEVIKDALQEIFIEFYLKHDRINVAPENLKYYLLLVLKRNLIKKLEAGRKISHEFIETVHFEPEYNIEFQIIEMEKDVEINSKVLYAINQLPAKQKEAIYLRFNESLEYDEIAIILEITVESVRKQVYRALKTVREIIDNDSIKIPYTNLLKKS